MSDDNEIESLMKFMKWNDRILSELAGINDGGIQKERPIEVYLVRLGQLLYINNKIMSIIAIRMAENEARSFTDKR